MSQDPSPSRMSDDEQRRGKDRQARKLVAKRQRHETLRQIFRSGREPTDEEQAELKETAWTPKEAEWIGGLFLRLGYYWVGNWHYPTPAGEIDDAVQELMVAILVALRGYHVDGTAAVSTFALNVMRWKHITHQTRRRGPTSALSRKAMAAVSDTRNAPVGREMEDVEEQAANWAKIQSVLPKLTWRQDAAIRAFLKELPVEKKAKFDAIKRLKALLAAHESRPSS